MFAKVFSQIFDSSIADDVDLRHFFMDLLVLADVDGDIDMTPQAISARTRIKLPIVMRHLGVLAAPDNRSRTPDMDGRRIELLDEHRDWGWKIINYHKFREIASNEQRKSRQRERFNRWKSKRNAPANASLTPSNASNAMQKQKQKQKQKQSKESPISSEVSCLKLKSIELDRWPLFVHLGKTPIEDLEASGWVDPRDGSAILDRIAFLDAFHKKLDDDHKTKSRK